MQREIHKAAYDAQKRLEANEDIVVGLNEYQLDEEIHQDLLRVDEALEKAQIDKTQHVRNTRDETYVETCLAELRKAARSNDNVMPFIVEAVKAYATVGEIANVMRDEFGEYTGM